MDNFHASSLLCGFSIFAFYASLLTPYVLPLQIYRHRDRNLRPADLALNPPHVHRPSFSAADSARSAWIMARAGTLAQSRGPTASATACPSRPIRKVVGRPITP